MRGGRVQKRKGDQKWAVVLKDLGTDLLESRPEPTDSQLEMALHDVRALRSLQPETWSSLILMGIG